MGKDINKRASNDSAAQLLLPVVHLLPAYMEVEQNSHLRRM